MSKIASTNPSLGYEEIGSVEESGREEIKSMILLAKKSQEKWKRLPVDERVKIMREIYDLFDKNREKIALSISMEMGMPISQSKDELQYGIGYLNWYLENAKKYLSPEVTFENETELHTVYFEPKGLVLSLAPRNYPFSMFIWTSMQALLSGNAVIFKTSKDCILTGKLIEDIIKSSSLPEGVFSEIYGSGSLGETVLREEDVDFVTFTGSTKVGKVLSKIALEKGIGCVMELGGSAPGIVLQDADLDKVIDQIYFLRYSNCGQMCDGLKRLIVHKSRYEETISRLIEILKNKKVGISTNIDTDIGPLSSENQLENLLVQYDDAIDKKALVLYKGEVPNNLKGAYFPPILLGNIDFEMKVWREEVFGPILPVVTFEIIEEAIKLANDTRYGLGAYVFTEDKAMFNQIALELQSGMVQLNNINYCIPASPFGGYKDSGIGREHGRWGFQEFTNIKAVSMNK